MRSPVVLVALGIHSIVVLALAVGAGMIFATVGPGVFLAGIVLFFGVILAAMLAVALAGAIGMWRGSERGYKVALWTQLVLALVLIGFVVEGWDSPSAGWRPALVGLALVLTSTILLLTPPARDEFGLDDIDFFDPSADPPVAVRVVIVSLVLLALVMNVALPGLAYGIAVVFGIATLDLDPISMLFEITPFVGLALFLGPAIAGGWATWRERRWGWWSLVVAHAGAALFLILLARDAWGRAYDPDDLIVPLAGFGVLVASSIALALPSTREWASL